MKTITNRRLAGFLFWVVPGLAQGPVTSPQPAPSDAIHFRAVDQLPPELVGYPMSLFVRALGTRLSTPQLGRTTLAGVLSLPGSPDTPITVVRQNPGRIRIESDAPGLASVIDQQSQKATAAMSGTQAVLAETLLFDSADFVLFDHANFGGTRYLGDAYPYPRAAAADRFYLFDHRTAVGLVAAGVIRDKRFFFNEKTGLLEYVQDVSGPYPSAPTGETAITWQKTGTEEFPASITHWERGVQVFAIHFTQATAEPAAADNTFSPQ